MSKFLKVKSATCHKLTGGKKLLVITAIISPNSSQEEKDGYSNWYDLVWQLENILKEQKPEN